MDGEDKTLRDFRLSPKVEKSRIDFAIRGSMRHQLLISDALPLVEQKISEFGNKISVSCSFGSCSVAILHMALKVNPDIKVIFNDTTVLYPEDYAYRDLLKEEWNLNLVETKPIKPFWTCWKEYGPPTIRRQYYHSYAKYKTLWKRHTFQEKTGKPACCWFCKDKPFLNACKQQNIEATLVGLRATESRARMYYAADYGQVHFAKRYKIWKINPILFWDQARLDTYFLENHIPKNKLYTERGLRRNGCQPCTGFLNWEQQLAQTNPKLYHFVQQTRGVKLMDDFIERENDRVDGCIKESLEAYF